MKKIIYSMLGMGLILGTTSCSDFLSTSSPSEADVDFVFASSETAEAALQNAYSLWRSSGNVHSNGAFYDIVVGSSDTEAQPESYGSQINRWVPSNYYGYIDNTKNLRGPENFPNVSSDGTLSGTWNNLYKIIAVCNTIINSFESATSFDAMIKQTEPSDLSQTYGEAIALRATCYYELSRYFGDVPLQTVSGQEATELTNRSYTAEYNLLQLKKVEPLMYRPGEGSRDKSYMSRTYVDGLIGRITLWEGGYQTRRTDLGDNYYTKLDGTPITFEKMYTDDTRKCFYGRRSDWKTLYDSAAVYLKNAVDKPGSGVKFQEADPRDKSTAGQVYGNPFQYVFQQMMDLTFADEDVYEIPETQGVQTERPYAFGRPSDGAKAYNYPCKTYGQCRFNPIYYYDDFDPDDMRRDVTVTAFGSRGNGQERLIPFSKGSTAKAGGLALNKWDENRMSTPYVVTQRQAGINCPYMRYSEILLMYAEVENDLGNTTEAETYLKKVHKRAFDSSIAEQKYQEFKAENSDLRHAIFNERKLEFGGEGVRKWDIIRSGYVAEIVKSFKTRTKAMIDDMQAGKAYHEFSHGNEFPAYVWIKDVDPAEYGVKYRLTTTCTDKENPVLWPAWRGQNDDWYSVGSYWGDPNFNNLKYGITEAESAASGLASDLHTNVAVKGLFKHIDEDTAAELEKEGYVKTAYGAEIVSSEKNIDDYYTYVFNGFDPDQPTPPVYMFPMHGDVIKQNPDVLIQGYGFKSK